MALSSRCMILPFLFLCVFQLCKGKKDFFNEVPKELRCNGCELTIKVLDQMLGIADKTNAHHIVDLALEAACEESRLAISEYKPEIMVKVCKFMTEFHHQELREALIKHYSGSKKSTYIELSQQICLNIMRLCPGSAHEMPKTKSTPEKPKTKSVPEKPKTKSATEKPKTETPPKMSSGGIYNKLKKEIPDLKPEDIDQGTLDQFKHFMKVSGHEAKLAKPVPENIHDEL